jgi:hypothetical protein
VVYILLLSGHMHGPQGVALCVINQRLGALKLLSSKGQVFYPSRCGKKTPGLAGFENNRELLRTSGP